MKHRLPCTVSEPAPVRWALIGIALAFVIITLVLPLALVLSQALAGGVREFWVALAEPDAQAALRLTLTAAAIAVPANLVFGVCAA